MAPGGYSQSCSANSLVVMDVIEGDTLVYLMTNENNEHWWLAEDGKG